MGARPGSGTLRKLETCFPGRLIPGLHYVHTSRNAKHFWAIGRKEAMRSSFGLIEGATWVKSTVLQSGEMDELS